MRAAVPWSRYQLDLTRSPLILLSMPQHNATHTHAHIHTLENTLATLCHQASAQPSNSYSRAKMAPEPFFCPWRARTHTIHTHTHTHRKMRLMVTGQPGLSATCQCPAPVLTTGATGSPPFYLLLPSSFLLSISASLYPVFSLVPRITSCYSSVHLPPIIHTSISASFSPAPLARNFPLILPVPFPFSLFPNILFFSPVLLHSSLLFSFPPSLLSSAGCFSFPHQPQPRPCQPMPAAQGTLSPLLPTAEVSEIGTDVAVVPCGAGGCGMQVCVIYVCVYAFMFMCLSD